MSWRVSSGRILTATGVGVACWLLLFVNAAQLRAHWDLTNLGHSRRYWEDLTVATVNHQLRAGYGFEGQPYGRMGVRVAGKLRALLPLAVGRAAVRPWQFWRTVAMRELSHVAPLRLRDGDDQGRAWLARLGFDLLGGVAPYLPLWLGLLAVLPLFVWTAVEGAATGHSWTAAVFLLLTASSTYVAELLTLPYSTAGYYLVGLMMHVPLALHLLLSQRPTLRGLVLRWAVAGALLCALTIGRGTLRAFAPALIGLAVVAGWRVPGAGRPGRWWRSAATAALAFGLVAGPYLALRPPFEHAVWMALWEGLGDFDREKGFAWNDPLARQAARREGYQFGSHIEPVADAEMEAIFKRQVVRAVLDDPGWYAAILARRIPATLLQLKLWPRAAVDGTPYALPVHPNEAGVDYYTFTRTADCFGAGQHWVELPLPLLWLPMLAATLLAVLPRARPLVSRADLGLVLALAMAAATTPLMMTTASAPETQAFLLVHLLSAGLVVQVLVRRRAEVQGHSRAA